MYETDIQRERSVAFTTLIFDPHCLDLYFFLLAILYVLRHKTSIVLNDRICYCNYCFIIGYSACCVDANLCFCWVDFVVESCVRFFRIFKGKLNLILSEFQLESCLCIKNHEFSSVCTLKIPNENFWSNFSQNGYKNLKLIFTIQKT